MLPKKKGFKSPKLIGAFFANPVSFVVSGYSAVRHTLSVLGGVKICNYFLNVD